MAVTPYQMPVMACLKPKKTKTGVKILVVASSDISEFQSNKPTAYQLQYWTDVPNSMITP